MCGAMPPLPKTPSWRCAQLKHGDNFTFTAMPHSPSQGSGSRTGAVTLVSEVEEMSLYKDTDSWL